MEYFVRRRVFRGGEVTEKIDENGATCLESAVDFYWFLVFESFNFLLFLRNRKPTQNMPQLSDRGCDDI